MRIPNADHEAHDWVIGRIAPDFRLMDVWALPVEGRVEEFDDVLDLVADLDPATSDSRISRLLFDIRFRLGRLLGWDDVTAERSIPGCLEVSLRERLPDELRGSADDTDVGAALSEAAGGFVPIYRTGEEWAAELSNATVHGVLHVSWVERSAGRYRAELAVYVKPRGWFGEAYLLLIDPFRHLIVYPALTRQVARAWRSRSARSA